jgi:hypothetical protein
MISCHATLYGLNYNSPFFFRFCEQYSTQTITFWNPFRVNTSPCTRTNIERPLSHLWRCPPTNFTFDSTPSLAPSFNVRHNFRLFQYFDHRYESGLVFVLVSSLELKTEENPVSNHQAEHDQDRKGVGVRSSSLKSRAPYSGSLFVSSAIYIVQSTVSAVGHPSCVWAQFTFTRVSSFAELPIIGLYVGYECLVCPFSK